MSGVKCRGKSVGVKMSGGKMSGGKVSYITIINTMP